MKSEKQTNRTDISALCVVYCGWLRRAGKELQKSKMWFSCLASDTNSYAMRWMNMGLCYGWPVYFLSPSLTLNLCNDRINVWKYFQCFKSGRPRFILWFVTAKIRRNPLLQHDTSLMGCGNLRWGCNLLLYGNQWLLSGGGGVCVVHTCNMSNIL